MNIFRTFSMAIKSIANNKMRSFLTMLGIIIGVCSVITLMTLIDGLTSQQLEYYEKMGSNIVELYYGSWGKYVNIDDGLEQEVARLSEYVVGITPNSSGNAITRYRAKTMENARIYYASKDFTVCKNMTLVAGRDICYMDVKNRVKVCVIGSYIQQELFGLENPIGKVIKIKGNEYTVVGVYESKYSNEEWSDDGMIAVPMSLSREIGGISKFENYLVKARSNEATNKAMYYLNLFMQKNIDQNNGYFSVYTNDQWQESQQESMALYKAIGGGVAGISLLVGGIGIMNIMLVSVSERTREIGIRMAIGAKRKSIVSQFLIEASAISACGGLLGIVFGVGGSALITAALMKKVYFPSPPTMLLALAFSMALGIFFGFYPAYKASNLQPVEALRNQ